MYLNPAETYYQLIHVQIERIHLPINTPAQDNYEIGNLHRKPLRQRPVGNIVRRRALQQIRQHPLKPHDQRLVLLNAPPPFRREHEGEADQEEAEGEVGEVLVNIPGGGEGRGDETKAEVQPDFAPGGGQRFCGVVYCFCLGFLRFE